jgi:hypothetical protein
MIESELSLGHQSIWILYDLGNTRRVICVLEKLDKEASVVVRLNVSSATANLFVTYPIRLQ